MDEKRIVKDIIEKAEIIAKCLKNGDCEIRRSASGITVAEVRKTVKAR